MENLPQKQAQWMKYFTRLYYSMFAKFPETSSSTKFSEDTSQYQLKLKIEEVFWLDILYSNLNNYSPW